MPDNTYQPTGLSSAFFSDIGTGVSDLFAAQADQAKAQGDILEGQAYQEASALATTNAEYTAQSTAIQQSQAERQFLLSQGKTTSEVAAGGFSLSGSALDILASNASQGALQKAVIGQQGLISEAGYNEQASSYNLMSQAAQTAATAEEEAAKGANIAGIINIAAGIASLGLPKA